ncbi:uncharacterized protein LOC131150936 [Malania oleifera]|uniref:uncharacterized protein LOC131150936 n=1 Tax=Malania oleifera TaxID=397392 RepID=UPI0025AEA1DA|nr:uncharacterized protein LOC131150936 [Malania oleifera]
MGQWLSASRRVAGELEASPEFEAACSSEYQHCLSLTQHAFPGVLPYQLFSASHRLHLARPHPLISKWVPDPPTQAQVDRAFRAVAGPAHDETTLGPAQFKAFAVELFAGAVLANAGKAVLRRVPVVIAGIAGIGAVTRPGKEVVGAAIGVYALGVAASVYLGLSG